MTVYCVSPSNIIYGGLQKSLESSDFVGVMAPSLLKMTNQWLWNGTLPTFMELEASIWKAEFSWRFGSTINVLI